MNQDPDDEPIPEERAGAPSLIRLVLQILLAVAGLVVGVWVLYKLAVLIFVLIVAALFAYVLAPLVQVAGHPIRVPGRSYRLPRGAAVGVVYLGLAVLISTAAALLLPTATEQAQDLAQRAPAYAQSILTWEHGWLRAYEHLRIPIEVRQSIDESAAAAGTAVAASIRQELLAMAGDLSAVPWLLLIPILAFFLLKDAASIRRSVVITLPHRVRLRSHRLFEDLNATVAAYIRAQLLACVLVGTACGLGFALLGVPYAVLLGVLAGILEFVPLIGPLLLAVAAAIIGALHAPMLALWVIGFLGVLRMVEDYVIYPRLIHGGMHLHPLAVIVGVLAGAELAGVAGMFLAVPAVAIAAVVWRHAVAWNGDDVA